jgi:hypothetical protein
MSLNQYQHVITSSLQTTMSTGNAGIDLAIGMILTSLVCYILKEVPGYLSYIWLILQKRLWPPPVVPLSKWKHVLYINDTTFYDEFLARTGRHELSRLHGCHHSLIILGVLFHLQKAGITTQSNKQTLLLASPDSYTKTREKYLGLSMTILTEDILEYRDMQFKFTRSKLSGEKKDDKSSETNKKDDSQPTMTNELNLEVHTNDIDMTFRFLNECKQNEIDRVVPDVPRPPNIYMHVRNDEFQSFKFDSCKTFSSIFFEEKERLMNTVQDFERRRGMWEPSKERARKLVILMHSAPGAGKTSSLKALANMTKRQLVVCDLKMCRSNLDLTMLFNSPTIKSRWETSYHVPLDKRILVLEDLDAANCPWLLTRDYVPSTITVGHGASALEMPLQERPTFSGFLNVLDGIHELTGLIVVITTNRIDHFDPALLRPGRVDLLIHLKPINADNALNMTRFLLGADKVDLDQEKRIRRILAREGVNVPPCKFQELIERVISPNHPNTGSVNEVIEQLEKLVGDPKHVEDEPMVLLTNGTGDDRN